MFQPIIIISRKTRIVWFNCFIASKSGSVSVNDNYSNSNVWHPKGFPGLHAVVWKFWRWKSESSEEGTLSGNSRFSSIFAVTSYECLGQKSGKTLCFRFQLTTKSEKQSVCKNYILSSYSFSPQDLLKASSKSFFISILLKGSKSLIKNGNKTEKTIWIFLEKRVKLEKISLPPPMFFSGKKSLTCNLLRIFLRKLIYFSKVIFVK